MGNSIHHWIDRHVRHKKAYHRHIEIFTISLFVTGRRTQFCVFIIIFISIRLTQFKDINKIMTMKCWIQFIGLWPKQLWTPHKTMEKLKSCCPRWMHRYILVNPGILLNTSQEQHHRLLLRKGEQRNICPYNIFFFSSDAWFTFGTNCS